jgi:hypothetical protein
MIKDWSVLSLDILVPVRRQDLCVIRVISSCDQQYRRGDFLDDQRAVL